MVARAAVSNCSHFWLAVVFAFACIMAGVLRLEQRLQAAVMAVGAGGDTASEAQSKAAVAEVSGLSL